MTLQLVYNTTDTIAVVDGDGRTVGGREWGGVETTDPAVKRLIASGDLVLADEDAARAAKLPAVAALDERRDRAEQARKLDTGALREATGDADSPKSELVREISADPSIVIPTTKAKSTGRAASGEK